jgi:hypothetical protein
MFSAIGNSNTPQTMKPRRKHARQPLPPIGRRSMAQRIQDADESWQDLWKANLLRDERQDKTDDAALLVAFSRVIHAVIDDRELCGQLLNYFDEKLESEYADRQGPVKP